MRGIRRSIAGAWVCLALVASCQEGRGPRTTDAEHSISFAEIDAYERSNERGAIVLSSTDASNSSTIVIRTVPYGARNDRGFENMIASTEASISQLPGVSMSDPVDGGHPLYSGQRYELTFRPKSKRGKEYERTHVLLFAEEHAIHVLHTAPKGEGDRARNTFETLMKSIEEEA